jgi:hypothetical protein
MASGDLQSQILAHVRIHGGIAHIAQSAEEWGTKVETVKSVLRRLRDQKKIHYLLHEHIRIIDPTLAAPARPPPTPPPTVPAVPEAKRRKRAPPPPPPRTTPPPRRIEFDFDDESDEQAAQAAAEEEEETPRKLASSVGELTDEEETRLLRVLTEYRKTADRERETEDG